MLYSFLKSLFRISLRVFFRNLQVKGGEHIPDKGPVLLVANHPSTFMDPIVIAANTKRRVYFLAKAEVFRSSFSKWLLPKFNMIPVHRAQDDPSQMGKNEETFSKCYDHFKNGGCILIFPEGISLWERKLKKIKTGAARITLGAEAANDFKLDVKIVSIGLNYSDAHRFQSDVLVNIDEPIRVKELEQEYKKDAFKAAHILTDEIRARLEKQVVAIEDAEVDALVKNIEIIYKSQLLKDLGYSAKIKEHDFVVTKAISERVHYFYEQEPERVEQMKKDIDDYFTALDRLDLSDRILKKFPGTGSMFFNSVFSFLYMVIGLPFFMFGFINNYLPYKLPYWITRKITKDAQYFGAITMVVGTFTFIIFYILQLWLVQHYFHRTWLTLLYLAVLPMSGFFAFFYWKRFTNIRGRWMIFSMFYRKTSLITSIISMRQHIIAELEKNRQEYIEKFGPLKV